MQAAFETIAIMSKRNGRWRGEAETSPGHQDLQRVDWLRAGDFHDVQDTSSRIAVHQQDEYVAAAAFRTLPQKRFVTQILAGGVHTCGKFANPGDDAALSHSS
jgi:hypothetical protein